MFKASCKLLDETVAIKMVDFDKLTCDLVRASSHLCYACTEPAACCFVNFWQLDLPRLHGCPLFKAPFEDSRQPLSGWILNFLPADLLCRAQDVIIKETQIMADQRHYNVLPLYCSFVSRNQLWLVMPFVSGGSLSAVMRASFAEVRACHKSGRSAFSTRQTLSNSTQTCLSTCSSSMQQI